MICGVAKQAALSFPSGIYVKLEWQNRTNHQEILQLTKPLPSNEQGRFDLFYRQDIRSIDAVVVKTLVRLSDSNVARRNLNTAKNFDILF